MDIYGSNMVIRWMILLKVWFVGSPYRPAIFENDLEFFFSLCRPRVEMWKAAWFRRLVFIVYGI